MNNFLTIIQNISLPNKYTKWYISIITHSLSKNRTTYTEKHHIVPKSFSEDLDINDINNPNNIVSLSAKEHYICHMLLTKMFKGILKRKMTYAIHRLSYSNNGNKADVYVSSRHYEQLRKQHSLNLTGEGNPMFGKTQSIETREKMSKKAIGRNVSVESRNKMSISRTGAGNAMYGKNHTEESRNKMSSSRKGKKTGIKNSFFGKHHTEENKKAHSEKIKALPKKECPYCNTLSGPANFSRWHGKNCKSFL